MTGMAPAAVFGRSRGAGGSGRYGSSVSWTNSAFPRIAVSSNAEPHESPSIAEPQKPALIFDSWKKCKKGLAKPNGCAYTCN